MNSFIPARLGTGTFELPFPSGIQQPFGSGLGPNVGQSFSYQNRDYQIPRVHQFHVGFEYTLPSKVTAEVSFVGSRTRKWPVAKNLNAIPLDERLKGVADSRYLTGSVPNQFAGAPELTGTSLAGGTVSRSQSLAAFPQFTGGTLNSNPIGNTSYNGLEVRLNKRLSGGVAVIGTYTFAKTMEATSFREPQYNFLEHVLSSFDRTHHLTVSALVELPFGRGKAIGSHWNKALNAVLGNWQYNVIIEHTNGTPTTLPDAIPLRDPRMPEGRQTFGRWFNTCTVLTSGARSKCASADEPVVWQQLKPNELRTYGSRFPNLCNHWRPQINTSVFKTFSVSERCKLEFRAEAFNAFNSPIYKGPNTSLTSANFGVVTLDQQNFPRNMQFATRVRF